jgi:hypothetical protein
MNKKNTFSIWYYVSIFGLILLLENMFFSGYAAKAIDYSEFRNRLQEKLNSKKEHFEALAQRLMEKEKIDSHDLAEILGPRPVKTDGHIS